jgi:hypothetical protein
LQPTKVASDRNFSAKGIEGNAYDPGIPQKFNLCHTLPVALFDARDGLLKNEKLFH